MRCAADVTARSPLFASATHAASSVFAKFIRSATRYCLPCCVVTSLGGGKQAFAPNKVLMCAENSQYWREVVKAQELINSGAIGQVLCARAKVWILEATGCLCCSPSPHMSLCSLYSNVPCVSLCRLSVLTTRLSCSPCQAQPVTSRS